MRVFASSRRTGSVALQFAIFCRTQSSSLVFLFKPSVSANSGSSGGVAAVPHRWSQLSFLLLVAPLRCLFFYIFPRRLTLSFASVCYSLQLFDGLLAVLHMPASSSAYSLFCSPLLLFSCACSGSSSASCSFSGSSSSDYFSSSSMFSVAFSSASYSSPSC